MIVILISLIALMVMCIVFLKGKPNLFMFLLVDNVIADEVKSDICEKSNFQEDVMKR